MVVSAKRIIDLNDKYHFLENLSERELKNPEGVGIDLRLAKAHRIVGPGYLGVTERDTSNVELVADIERGDKEVVIAPGETILATTMETINLPGTPVDIGDDKPAILMVDI